MWTKKIAFHWCTEEPALQRFKLVFRVALGHVKPGMTVEDIIIAETTGFKRRYNSDDIKNVLHKYAKQTLVLLDGLDEINLENNEDIMDIIKGGFCDELNIIVTSRQEVVTTAEIFWFSLSDARVY